MPFGRFVFKEKGRLFLTLILYKYNYNLFKNKYLSKLFSLFFISFLQKK